MKQLSEDVIEIRRAILHHDFYNTMPYPEEIIVIDRSKLAAGGVVYEAYLAEANGFK